jgi:hypothetical protein
MLGQDIDTGRHLGLDALIGRDTWHATMAANKNASVTATAYRFFHWLRES